MTIKKKQSFVVFSPIFRRLKNIEISWIMFKLQLKRKVRCNKRVIKYMGFYDLKKIEFRDKTNEKIEIQWVILLKKLRKNAHC